MRRLDSDRRMRRCGRRRRVSKETFTQSPRTRKLKGHSRTLAQGGAVLLGLGRVQEAAGLIELMFADQDLGGQGWVQVC
jgi:hypothetical protein